MRVMSVGILMRGLIVVVNVFVELMLKLFIVIVMVSLKLLLVVVKDWVIIFL